MKLFLKMYRYGEPNLNGILFTPESVDKAIQARVDEGNFPLRLGFDTHHLTDDTEDEVAYVPVGVLKDYKGQGVVEVEIRNPNVIEMLTNQQTASVGFKPLAAGTYIGDLNDTYDRAVIQDLVSLHLTTEEELMKETPVDVTGKGTKA